MRLFQGCFLIIRLVFSRKHEWFIRWHHWFGWYFPCIWIIWVIRRCFQRVIWGQWRQHIRQHLNSILCHMYTFPPSLHHYDRMCLPIRPQPRLSFASHQKVLSAYFCHGGIDEQDKNIILCWRLIQTKNMIMEFVIPCYLRLWNNSLNK